MWEQSFPSVGGIGLPVTDPRSGDIRLVRLTRRQAADRAEKNQRRLAQTLADLESLGLQAVVLGSSDPDTIDAAFNDWAEQRRSTAWAR